MPEKIKSTYLYNLITREKVNFAHFEANLIVVSINVFVIVKKLRLLFELHFRSRCVNAGEILVVEIELAVFMQTVCWGFPGFRQISRIEAFLTVATGNFQRRARARKIYPGDREQGSF